MIIIEKWFGRLGNNIISLCNIIDIALFYKHSIRFKVSHEFFNLKMIEEHFSNYSNENILKDVKSFYYGLSVPDEKYTKINLLKRAFLVKNINKLDEAYVVIHIRSGDTFRKKRPHVLYTPPPLSFFEYVLNKHDYKKIIILCEDKVNPLVDKLLGMYENSTYSKNTLEEDIRILLGATNVISSVGTFVPSLMLLSDNIKYHYSVDHTEQQLGDYYSFMKPWKNTPQQRAFMLNYKIPESFEISPNAI